MKKKTIALFMTAAMMAALCGCGSQPETTVVVENPTEDSEAPGNEDTTEEISAADEETADDTEDENADGESEDLTDDSTALDADNAEEGDEAEEPDESDEDDSASFDLGFMSFELPADWGLDDYESSSEDGEYYFAPGGDVYASDVIISVAHTNSEEEPEMASFLSESEGADREEYLKSELGIDDDTQRLSIKDLGQTFIGKTVEIHVALSDEEAIGFMVVYLGLDNDDIYGILLAGSGATTEDDIDIQDGMAAIDMLFETGELLK